jgi:hypothetical protein
MLVSDHFMQNLSDMMKSVGTSFHAMTSFSLPETTAKTSSQPPGRFVIIWRSKTAALAMFTSLFREWTWFRS